MNNDDQLTMDFVSSIPKKKAEEVVPYELLDFQLADLMQALNTGEDKTLRACTLEISKHTREGAIAVFCSPEQQIELVKTKVVGEVFDADGRREGEYKPLILDKDHLYLRRYWQYQQQLADQINSRLDNRQNTNDTEHENKEQREEFNKWLEQRLDYYFKGNLKNNATTSGEQVENDWQRIAAERALKHSFLLISGGPGTGKTTTITRLLALLIEVYTNKHTSPPFAPFMQDSKRPIRILLAAPTGKAAIRMVDAIRESQLNLDLSEAVSKLMPTMASTLHKLLGYIHAKAGFKHKKNNPLNADIVLVDEASMIDIAMMTKLIEAVPSHAKLILIGDKDQLASVETGSVFADICEGLKNSKQLLTLQKNWRFDKNSGIGQLAIAANNADDNKVVALLKDDTDQKCRLISPGLIAGNLINPELIEPWKHYFTVLNNSKSTVQEIFDAFNQYRVLCALRRGLNGSQIMNSRIETTLAKQGLFTIKALQGNNTNWYHGRPVMVTRNDYSKGLFNGDTGIALIEKGQLNIYFPDEAMNEHHNDNRHKGFKAYSPVRLPAHETTWAMTIHKSQGSEFDQVTLILPHEVMPLLTKQLIYTGITRAKDSVNIVADEAVLRAGIKTEVVRATRIGCYLKA